MNHPFPKQFSTLCNKGLVLPRGTHCLCFSSLFCPKVIYNLHYFFVPRWFKLHSKVGRKAKERGELQVTVQFTRNNMTASMFDLTMKDKSRSAFGKLKDRVTGRKRGDVESSSAIVPGRYAALSGFLGQPFGEDIGGVSQEIEITEEKRSKMKDFFKGRLRKSSDTKSCSSLASESSMSSMASDNPGPPPSLDLLSDRSPQLSHLHKQSPSGRSLWRGRFS